MLDYSKFFKVGVGRDGEEFPNLVSADRVIDWLKEKGIDLAEVRKRVKTVGMLPEKEKMKEDLGFLADEPILSLVWVLNAMGIRTRASCGGHEGRMMWRPFVTLDESEVEKIVAVMENWEGIKSNDVVFSRMPSDEGGEKDLVDVYFMEKSLEEGRKLVDRLVEYLVGGKWLV
jgi:hypothetical protein